MLDFLRVSTRSPKRGITEIYPKFIIGSSSDLMIRGEGKTHIFYAIWDEESHLWSTSEEVALYLIDKELDEYAKTFKSDDSVRVLHMWDSDNGMVDKWKKFCEKQMFSNSKQLDEKLTFSNTKTKRSDYISHVLPYALEACPIPAYEELISVLYSPEERHKIEWAIGSIITGDSRKNQKFLVLYGSAGTGKSTVLNIIQDLFSGYYSVFDAKALGSSNNAFALEPFNTNPLVAIQHDGDLSKIEDNTRLNSIVSHEMMTVNEKFKATYSARFNAFLFMGTNHPVKITDAKSGIIRRLIDVSPTGKKVSASKYKELISKIKFELGGIANHCKEVYLEDPAYYDSYVPLAMMGASNDFYNFVFENFDTFNALDSITLKSAWEKYKEYIEEANVHYPYSQRVFKEELKNYFKDFKDRTVDENGKMIYGIYSGFIPDKFFAIMKKPEEKKSTKPLLELNCTKSLLDDILKDCPAQYTSSSGTPLKKWVNVRTTLSALKTTELHYVKPPVEHIVVDFDLKDENGEKSFERNAEAAAKWPATYAELSKGGAGIHLHYIYTGDTSKLSCMYDDDIEVKVFAGNSSLRRKLSKCNDIPVATISTGLPLKEEVRVVNYTTLKNERALITLIKRAMNKEYEPHATKPMIDFIFSELDKANKAGTLYDVRFLKPSVMNFAASSSHNAEYCMNKVTEMKFVSDAFLLGENSCKEENNPDDQNMPSDEDMKDQEPIIFFDVEVFSNLLVLCWKAQGKDCVSEINPSAERVETLLRFGRWVGFNNRKYDNHILYARAYRNYSEEQLFRLSCDMIQKKIGFISGAYNLSYTDIYDFCAKKQGLKKWQIELGIHHQELGLAWDQPVPEDKWTLVAEYCKNDVEATEAVFEARQGDFTARKILAALTNGTVNDTTNALTTRLIFGKERSPQSTFCYRDLSKPILKLEKGSDFMNRWFPEMMSKPHGEAGSVLPYFNNYTFADGKSIYKGYEVGEGGFVWAKPGMYADVITFDVASMHPHSITSEYLFGPYTERFNELMEARISIKHKDFESAGKLFDGKLSEYLTDPNNAKALSNALKIAINSVYGLTAAKFENPFRDPRNVDNIVAKRGALFMIDLLDYVHSNGGEVIHIKTDSIKIVNPSEELINQVMTFGKRYGYTFEVEHKFKRICLVNNAVYIAKLADDDPEEPGTWTATGAQFAQPYIFKRLFSKEKIEFEDMCETKSVSDPAAIYIDSNERLPDGEHNYIYVGKTGQFCPIQKGHGGGELLRGNGPTYGSVTGTKGYHWMESEVVSRLNLQEYIDRSYYEKLVNEAKDSISKYGDFEWFVSDD